MRSVSALGFGRAWGNGWRSIPLAKPIRLQIEHLLAILKLIPLLEIYFSNILIQYLVLYFLVFMSPTPLTQTAIKAAHSPACYVGPRAFAQITQGGQWRLSLPHSVPWPQFVWITRGSGSLMIGPRKRVISGAAMAFVPANTLMAFDLGGGTFGSILGVPKTAEANLPNQNAYVRVSDMKLHSTLNGLWDNLVKEVARPDRQSLDQTTHATDDAALANHAALLGVWLVRNKMPQDQIKPSAATKLMARFTSHLTLKSCTSDTVSDYAKALGVTATHLSRICNSEFGVPASRLLQLTKLYEARRLLADTNVNVQGIATQTGFANAAYFTRVFQQQTDQTPTGFRTQTRAAPKPVRSAATGPALTVKFGRALVQPARQTG